MRLKGSCHCGAVRFTVEAQSPVPFMRCHCSICRKTAGSGGYAVNLGAKAATLKVRGEQHLGTYHALMREAGRRATRGVERVLQWCCRQRVNHPHPEQPRSPLLSSGH